MSFTVYFYTFAKKANSTARPNDATGTSYTCQLNDQSSILHPTIKLALPLTSDPSHLNYARVPVWDRYYFVREWSFVGGLWEASLDVDPLASWKESIGNTHAFVLRSSAESDGDIVDNLYPAKMPYAFSTVSFNPTWAFNLSMGSYVVGIISGTTAGTGATTYYVFSPEEFKSFCNLLFGTAPAGMTFTESFTEDMFKSIFNPFQYVVSCMWIPSATIPVMDTPVSEIAFGWWSVPLSASVLSGNSVEDFTPITITLPKHPQAATRGRFLNMEPYSRYCLFCPPFGSVPLDSTMLSTMDTIKLIIKIDCITGMGNLYVEGATGSSVGIPSRVITAAQTQIGVPIQLAQISIDYLGTASAVIDGASSVVSSIMAGDVLGGIVGGASAIGNALQASAPQLMTSGAGGSLAGLKGPTELRAQFFPITDEDNDHRGRPLCSPRQIKDVPGYLLCADGEVPFAGSPEELEAVRRALATGFFYE